MAPISANDPHPSAIGSARGEFQRGWKVLVAGVLGVAFGASPIPFNILGFTVEPLNAEFGWTKTQLMVPIMLYGIVASLLAPLYGWLADRFGVRPVALWSLFAFGVLFASISMTPASLLVYYGLWFLVGLVGIGSTPVTWSRAVNLWFFRSRGIALGILLLGTSISALVVPHVAVWSIEQLGWRFMFVTTAALSLGIALPAGVFFFREPTPEERPPEIRSDDGDLAGVSLSVAMRDYRFWLIWMSVVLIAGTFGGAFVNMVPILADRGFPATTAAVVITALGFGVLTGRIVTGLLLDRFWAGFVAFPLLCLPALSSLILLHDSVTLSLAVLAGFLLGLAAGAESDLIAYVTGRYFGMRHYGKIYGMLYMPFGIFSGVSPLIYAAVRDTTGSYDTVLTASVGTYILGGALLLALGGYPSFGRQELRTGG
ncbi:MFS transporter [Lentisalinibacter orientalis]|uniref:MFS transporter n=1 Tax=Lentisalinibacter orientalis TaxID=2992241 RepID=UPI003869D56C